jgi:hypothetical protein
MMLQLQGIGGYKYHAVEALLSLLSIKQVLSNSLHTKNELFPTNPPISINMSTYKPTGPPSPSKPSIRSII